MECSGKNCTLIKKLMDSQTLTCQCCKKLLQIPVFLVDGKGNVCENCTLENGWKGTQNEVFNVLLKELTIPCTNVIVGCDAEIPYEDLDQHLKICKYRPVQCPHLECAWKERQDNLYTHFLEDHKEDVNESDGEFHFELNIEEPSVYFTRLLIKKDFKFLFIFKQNKQDDELDCTLFKFQKNGPDSATISFCNNEKEEHNFKMDINLLDLIDQQCNVDTIRLSFLKAMAHGDNTKPLSLSVNILPNYQRLQFLECPICYETMRPPIYLCGKGHSICNICKSQISNCPTCSAAIKDLRNYALESAGSSVYYSCVYKSSGCTTVLTGEMIMDHESKCLYHIHKCPHCDFRYNSKTVLNHLKDKHGNVTNSFQCDIGHDTYSLVERSEKNFYINGCFFEFSYYDYPVVSKNSSRLHTMHYVYLGFTLLNPEKSEEVRNLYCKTIITNQVTKSKVTQIHFFDNKGTNSQWVFVPVEAFCFSIDASKKASFQFKCELLMK